MKLVAGVVAAVGLWASWVDRHRLACSVCSQDAAVSSAAGAVEADDSQEVAKKKKKVIVATPEKKKSQSSAGSVSSAQRAVVGMDTGTAMPLNSRLRRSSSSLHLSSPSMKGADKESLGSGASKVLDANDWMNKLSPAVIFSGVSLQRELVWADACRKRTAKINSTEAYTCVRFNVSSDRHGSVVSVGCVKAQAECGLTLGG